MINTAKLLSLWDARPKVINYDNNDDRAFCNRVLLTLKAAIPELQTMLDMRPTNQARDAAGASTPSNAAPPEPAAAQNTHTQAAIPDTAGTASSPDHKPDTAGKPSSVGARLAAARKAAAARRNSLKPKHVAAPMRLDPAALLAAQPATDETAQHEAP